MSASTAKMLISREKNKYLDINAEKTSTGCFYTAKDTWLTEPVADFVRRCLPHISGFLDPFAGEGHLLNVCASKFSLPIAGFDLNAARWEYNDSLISIPPTQHLIVTNPPYLAKHSASRKGVADQVQQYYESSDWDDLYQIAILRCLEAARITIAIIPETFLNSNFPKDSLVLASVLENNPFTDTTVPVCVACFDNSFSDGAQQAKLYVENQYCGHYGDIFCIRQKHQKNDKVIFNDPTGNIALRAVDSTDPNAPIRFLPAEDFHYHREKIKVSSRLLTYLSIESLPCELRDKLITVANQKLQSLRTKSHDLILSPFKGNNRDGRRRRRLDYALARWILHEALEDIRA